MGLRPDHWKSLSTRPRASRGPKPSKAPSSLRLLVPIDFTRESEEALDRAIAISESFGVTGIHAVHVRTPGRAEPTQEQLAVVRERLESRSHARPEWVVQSHEAPTVLEGILAAAEAIDAQLIIVGTRGGQIMAAGIAERLIHRTERDVLVLSHASDLRWPGKPTRILVPVDFSANAQRAARAARRWAGTNTVAMLHVVNQGALNQTGAASAGRMRSRVADWAEGLADEVAAAEGDPSHVVADEVASGEVGLVVIGASGARDVGTKVRGGMPERLIQTARAPVLVVH